MPPDYLAPVSSADEASPSRLTEARYSDAVKARNIARVSRTETDSAVIHLGAAKLALKQRDLPDPIL